MKKLMFFAMILPMLLGCAENEISSQTHKKSVTLPLTPSETRNHPVTWHGSPALEPGLSPKGILLFEDFEDDHYRKRWRVHWNDPVGAGMVERPSKCVFAGNRSAYLENKEEKHEADGEGNMCLRSRLMTWPIFGFICASRMASQPGHQSKLN